MLKDTRNKCRRDIYDERNPYKNFYTLKVYRSTSDFSRPLLYSRGIMYVLRMYFIYIDGVHM